MASTKRSLKPTTKDAWAKANDTGPHLAALPTGKVVKFRIPDSSTLLRSGRIPKKLRETCLAVAAHPEGYDGYLEDLSRISMHRMGSDAGSIAEVLEEGLQLAHHLIAEMLVEPEVTAEEVEAGIFHRFDIEMLLEFAERRRSVDATGNRLPIITLDEWARFRNVPRGVEGPEPGGENGHVDTGDLSDTDGGAV